MPVFQVSFPLFGFITLHDHIKFDYFVIRKSIISKNIKTQYGLSPYEIVFENVEADSGDEAVSIIKKRLNPILDYLSLITKVGFVSSGVNCTQIDPPMLQITITTGPKILDYYHKIISIFLKKNLSKNLP